MTHRQLFEEIGFEHGQSTPDGHHLAFQWLNLWRQELLAQVQLVHHIADNGSE